MTRAVTDILYRTDGTAWASAPVTFERTAGSFDDGSSWPPDEKQVTTDATGAYSVQLWPDAAGSIRSRYHVTYPNGDRFYISIPDGSTPISMPEIRVAAVTPPTTASEMDAHVHAADPHTGYLLPAEADAVYAQSASPALTGTPTAPTAANGTNTGQLATTAFVQAAVASGGGGGDWSTLTGTPTTLAGYGITDAYTKAQIDTALGGKADRATTLAGYGITDAYTKVQVDTALGGKANAATTLGGYGITDAYTKTQTDAAYAPIVHSHTFASLTAKPTTIAGYGMTDAYTKAEADASLALKANLAGGNSFTGLQTIQAGAAATTAVIVKGFASQSADLQQWQDSTGAVLARVDSAGRLGIGASPGAPIHVQLNSATAANAIRLFNSGATSDGRGTVIQFFTDVNETFRIKGLATAAGSNVGRLELSPLYAGTERLGLVITAVGNLARVGIGTATPAGALDISSPTPSVVGLMVKGAASQTGDLQQWQDSGGAVLARTNKAGYRVVNRSAAPADADLAAGEMTQWFDQTTGAAKLMIKAKNAAGTVVTGQVALA